MSFQIRDNLPEMDKRIYKSEIRLLMPFAGIIFSELGRLKEEESPLTKKKEHNLIESLTISKSLDHSPG